MAARIFTIPQSLDSTLAMAQNGSSQNGAAQNGPTQNGHTQNGVSSENETKRASTSAREATQSFPKEAREPLAMSASNLSKPGVTFAAQENLPKLPIPELDATCKRYLEALEPLQSPGEHEDTTLAVREFLRSDGPRLQDRLRKYATGKSSYIEQFCKLINYFIRDRRIPSVN